MCAACMQQRCIAARVDRAAAQQRVSKNSDMDSRGRPNGACDRFAACLFA
jgi:hypothetical protein